MWYINWINFKYYYYSYGKATLLHIIILYMTGFNSILILSTFVSTVMRKLIAFSYISQVWELGFGCYHTKDSTLLLFWKVIVWDLYGFFLKCFTKPSSKIISYGIFIMKRFWLWFQFLSCIRYYLNFYFCFCFCL